MLRTGSSGDGVLGPNTSAKLSDAINKLTMMGDVVEPAPAQEEGGTAL
jgi:hypothetical protein